LQKALEDAQTVAGGALITSVFLKKVSVALAKRGHIAVFISQVRETVKINPYTITPPKQGGASGGHALEHAADLVLEFQSRFSDDIIRENPNDKNSKPIGHFAKCRIVKSNNESYLRDVRYPILYGRKNGHSIWREKEVADMAIMWELVVKKGAWITPIETFVTELQENDLQIEEKFHGIEQFYQWIEKNPKVVDFIAKRFS
jgi:RecA/RadA recombinase